MPRVVQNRSGRVPSPTYRYAYLMERNGTWYAVCHDWRRSTGYKALKSTIPDALRMLDRFVVQTTDPGANVALTVSEALKEFLAVKGDNVTEEHLATFATAISAMLPRDVALADTRGIRDQITQRRKETDFKPSTIKQYFTLLRHFFAWAKRAGYIDINPMEAVENPVVATAEPVAPSYTELETIYAHLRSRHSYRRLKITTEHKILCYKFLALSGLRMTEFLKLRTSHIDNDYIKVDGKRKTKHIPRTRYIPLDLIPGLRAVTDELIAKSKGGQIALISETRYKAVLDSACRALEIEHYSMHDLRRTALNHWRDDLHLPQEVRASIAGHSPAMAGHYYKQIPREKLLEMALKTRVGGIRQEILE